ncbi:hypothetical protein PPERSA_10284 [Pseudocohnilembus persalinus]|uniref:Uncharacterized protein n=1 Tax=Pseudocohnilembus persalinus TaxID=266149 RepID=A0A0V0R143_PSEPJ|nr:hypothetical protein PPERSA_10284 [Pseudocohnilembus persalinus]|eukprot:KRX07896.1 hypothetical protein PPERSA_10284 [Pseudocohnilembus persalinus]
MQTLQEQQKQKLQNYLRAEENCQKMKEKIQENLERIKEKQEKQSEEILNEFQNRFEKVSYNKHKLQDEQFYKTDKFKKFKDIQEANKRRLQLEQDIKADDLLHTAFEKKSNLQHQKSEQEKLKFISQNLKELGSLTYSDSFKYKQFFPEEKKKKPEDGDED